MWWRDYGGVMPPSDCSLQYYNSRSREWTDITDLIDETGEDVSSVGVKFGTETTAAESSDDYQEGANRYWNGVS